MKKNIAIVLLFLSSFFAIAQKNVQSADAIIHAATKKAKKENKKIFVKFSASWCGWCHKMTNAINDSTIDRYFTNNYVIVQLDVLEGGDRNDLETKGGLDYLKKYGGLTQGLPYWVIIDSAQTIIANSKLKADDQPLDGEGDNVGCPTQKNEIDYFIRVLKNTSTLNAIQLKRIRTRFDKIRTEQ